MRSFIRRSPGARTHNPIARSLAPAGALGLALALGACAVAPPTGPTVMALPAKGKNFATFRQEDMSCRQYAEQQIGYMQPAQAANNAAVGSALVGTALGAAAGAAIGSVSGNVGAGAAIGAGAGLLGGSAIGASNAQASAGDLQQRYNIAYTQCMYSNGNTVVSRPPGYGYGGGYPGPGYGYPPPPYGPYYGPVYPQPGVSVGIGGGWYR